MSLKAVQLVVEELESRCVPSWLVTQPAPYVPPNLPSTEPGALPDLNIPTATPGKITVGAIGTYKDTIYTVSLMPVQQISFPNGQELATLLNNPNFGTVLALR
jgi:hypothetical protein